MKTIYLTISLFIFSFAAKAQVCKILISYDDNGNRIKREKSCIGNRPASEDTAGNDLAAKDLQPVTDVFAIYPNPTTTQVNIRLSSLALKERCELTITDGSGKTLKTRLLSAPLTDIDLAGFADGPYLFILRRGTQVNTIKVMKTYGAGVR